MDKSKYIEMQTEIMEGYPPSNPQELKKTFDLATKMKTFSDELVEKTRKSYIFTQIKDVVDNNYDIGKVVEVFQIFGGYVNNSFGIYTEKDGEKQTWFLRMYKSNKKLASLLFEHTMLLHAKENGFTFGAIPILKKDGKTYIVAKEFTPGDEKEIFFAVFNYIDGKATYNWIPNWAHEGVPEITLKLAGKCLAQFHNSTKDYDPKGKWGDNIMDNEDILVNDIIKTFPQRLKKYRQAYAEAGYENAFTEYYDSHYDFFTKISKQSLIPEKNYKQMVFNVCHCDFHAGNFLYREDGSIAGNFDFDMAKVDARLFDVGLHIHYTYASWLPADNGAINLDNAIKFLNSYNEELSKLGGLEPLNNSEKKYLFEVILQAPLYVLGWAAADIYRDTTLNPHEYLYYTQHFVESMKWLEKNEKLVRETFERELE